MTLQTTGPISFRNIADEFTGGTDPISLAEYYRAGAYVPAGTAIGTGAFFQSPAVSAQIPLSGAIQLSQFYGTRRAFIFNDVISSNYLSGYSLTARATTAGWDGVAPLIATVTVNSGVLVTGPTTLNAFTTFRTGGYPVGSTLTITNNGNIIGGGGNGGNGGSYSGGTWINGSDGSYGGTGLFIDNTIPTIMTNNGTIGGGGGGGGGGTASVTTYYDAGTDTWTTTSAGGGGGGAGAAWNGLASGGNGGAGDVPGVGGGLPGTPPAWNVSPSIFTYGNAGTPRAGAGGEAGMPGFPGVTGGGSGGSPGAGGPRGRAVEGLNATLLQWTNYGTIRGGFAPLIGMGTWAGGGANYSSLISSYITSPVFNSLLNVDYTTVLGPIWYGYTQNSGLINIPVGNYTYHTWYTNTGADVQAHLYGGVDNDLISMTVNGASHTAGTTMGYTTTYQTNPFTLVTGVNVISVTIANSGAGLQHAFNLRVRRHSDNADLTHPSMWYF